MSSLLQQCADLLKANDVRNEVRQLLSPVLDLVLSEVYPYIYALLVLIVFLFLMILAILVLVISALRTVHGLRAVAETANLNIATNALSAAAA